MKLTVLVDNNTLIDRYFVAEPGVSYFIEDGDSHVLFDVGYSDVFIKNAHKMAHVDLLDVDFVVLSHSHLDHTWGLVPLIALYTEAIVEGIHHKRPTLVAHPSTFVTRTLGDLGEIGSLVSQRKLARHFDLRLSQDPVWLTDRLVFLGEIERRNGFEAKRAIGQVVTDEAELVLGVPRGAQHADYLMDDSALAYRSSSGLVIITGCSHAGICNIVAHAQNVCGDDRVADIVGGFHLLEPSEEQLRGTLRYMEALQPARVHACHCTDLNSKIALSRVVDLEEVGVGLTLEYG
jgi:7,8-dihydropterin-6-yl-methyl-4-(beta-D-ribofuranosyl)aminobenzene 5'-phosphate synthase